MIYVGPHVSIAKDISLAPVRAKELGSTAFGLFLKNQKVWNAPPLKEESIKSFKENIIKLGFKKEMILPHAGYLINMASPNEENRSKSFALLSDEIKRALELGLEKINIHPGAFIEGERDDGIKRCASMLDEALKNIDGFYIALENTAGSGTNLGSTFEELSKIIDCSKEKDKIAITLDTCHLYAAGYDIKNEPGKVLDEAVKAFGEDKIKGFHINDSKALLNSKKDRHHSLGKGEIGLEAIKEVVRHRAAKDKPLVLETIDEDLWKDEIRTLHDAEFN